MNRKKILVDYGFIHITIIMQKCKKKKKKRLTKHADSGSNRLKTMQHTGTLNYYTCKKFSE